MRSLPLCSLLFALLPTMMLAQTPVASPTAAQAPRAAASQPAPASPQPDATAGMTDEQKTIYALGLLVQRSLQAFEFDAAELEIVKRAITDAGNGTPALSLDEWGPRVQPFAQERALRMMAREKAASAAYLDTAAAAAGAVRTETGIVFTEMTAGAGASPTPADVVRVHYRGTLRNGTEFDSSYARNEPVEFPLARVIPCWTQGVQRMKVGGKARLVCPSDLAYGDAGTQGIPGGAALIFEVELLGIVPPPPAPGGTGDGQPLPPR
jgi:FKBP-type peptidyl-prolyl cis-trans isomerase FkpA